MLTYILIVLLLAIVVLSFIIECQDSDIGFAIGISAVRTSMGIAVIFVVIVVMSVGQVFLTEPETSEITKVHQIAKGSVLDIDDDKQLNFIAVDDQGKPYSVDTSTSAGLEFTGDGTSREEVEITEIAQDWGNAIVPWTNIRYDYKVVVR